MMMSGFLTCEASELWVFTKVLDHYHVPFQTLPPLDATETTARLLYHAHTKQEAQRVHTILEAVHVTLKVLHFMGHVHVAETLFDGV
jgi:hypothetical protein